MTFPDQDPYWIAAAEFLRTHVTPGEQVIAPTEFRRRLGGALVVPVARWEDLNQTQWVVVHKGRLDSFQPAFLFAVADRLRPVFANEVFVIYTVRGDLAEMRPDDDHVRALTIQLNELRGSWAGWQQPLSRDGGALLTLEQIAEMPRSDLEAACRRAAQFAYLGDRTGLCRVLTRYLFLVDTSDLTVAPHLALNGFWEPWITQAIARELRPGLACLDIGANLGYFSVLMADAVGSSGRVLAVEPHPRLADLLNSTIDLNGFRRWTTVHQAAVTSEAGRQLELVVPGRYWGDATIRPDPEFMAHASDRESIRVESTTVDELTAEWQSVDLVKIDVEGAEEWVWKGMSETLRRNPQITVIMEFTPRWNRDAGAFLSQIQREGFLLAHIRDDASIEQFTLDGFMDRQPDWMMLFLRRG